MAPKKDKIYQQARKAVRAVWQGKPVNITEIEKSALFVPLEGFAPMHFENEFPEDSNNQSIRDS